MNFPKQKAENKIKEDYQLSKTDYLGFWSPIDFRVVKLLPQGITFTADCFINTISRKLLPLNQQPFGTSLNENLLFIWKIQYCIVQKWQPSLVFRIDLTLCNIHHTHRI
jgi:hypothetical protein